MISWLCLFQIGPSLVFKVVFFSNRCSHILINFQQLFLGKENRENASWSDVLGGRLHCLWTCIMCIHQHRTLLRLFWRSSSYDGRISPWKPEFKFPTSNVFLDGDVTIVYFDPGGTGWDLPLWFPGNVHWFWFLVCLLVRRQDNHSCRPSTKNNQCKRSKILTLNNDIELNFIFNLRRRI